MADFGEQNVQCHNDNQYLFQNEKKNDNYEFHRYVKTE